MVEPRTAQADVGGRQVIRVGASAPGSTTACRVSVERVEALFRRPARSLTLWEAAHLVAHLHHAGDVRLTTSPRFSPDCRALQFPGPSAAHAGRFIVSIEGWVRAQGNTVSFVYLARAGRGYAYRPGPINHVDVRLVVLLHHLVSRLGSNVYDGQRVRAIVHNGFNGKLGDRQLRGGVNRRTQPPTRYSVYRLHDAHWSGRAIDFSGALLGAEGSAPIAGWADRRVADGHSVIIQDHWGDAPAVAGRGFRLAADLSRPGTPAGERARLLRHAMEVFAKHSSLGRVDDPGATPLDPYLTGARGGWLIHPDYQDAGARSAHQDHIHAQVGPLNYEFPTSAARQADLAGPQQERERGTRAQQHQEQGGVRVSQLGTPPTIDAATTAP